MYGAILGDMIGAPYEFDRSKQNKDFDIRWSAEVTHNHPEGIKGAEATAAAIFLAWLDHMYHKKVMVWNSLLSL